MQSLSLIAKDLADRISKAYTVVSGDTILKRIKNHIVESAKTQNDGTMYNVIKESAFTNLPPKIGYIDETTVPIYAAFNMSFSEVSGEPCWVTSDMEGREVTYFRAAANGETPQKVFRAFRSSLDDAGAYTYENTPVCPSRISENMYFQRIYGISNGYLVALSDDNKILHIATQYSSNVKNWTLAKDLTSVCLNGQPLQSVVWFESVGRYLITRLLDTQLLYQVFDANLNLQYEDVVFDMPKLHNSSHPSWVYSFTRYDESGATTYVPGKNMLVAALRTFPAILDNNFVIQSYGSGPQVLYCNHINNFTPENLLTNHYFQTANWATPLDRFYDAANWDQGGGNGSLVTNTRSRGLEFIQYDELNKMLYLTSLETDTTFSRIRRIPLDRIQTDQQGVALFTSEGSSEWGFAVPDTSPWAKQTFAPSVKYDSIVLSAQSTKYGSYEGYGEGMSIAVRPEETPDPHVLSVQSGSWTLWNSQITNFRWNNWTYCSCTKEDFNAADGVSWYDLDTDDQYIYVRRLQHGERKDQVGRTWDDNISIDRDNYVAKFRHPQRRWAHYPKGTGGTWAFRSSSFGGGSKLIVFSVWDGKESAKCVKNEAGAYSVDSQDDFPCIFILSEGGSCDALQLPQEFKDMWMSTVNDYHPYTRALGSGNRTAFLDSDGLSFFFSTYTTFHGNGDFQFRCMKVKLDSDLKSISTYQLLENGYGSWCGIESLGWNKRFGYYRTFTPDSRCSSNISCSKTSIDNAIAATGDAFEYRFSNSGSVGLIAYIQSIPIYLGGYFSVMPSCEVYLTPNADNYIYLSRDKIDYTKVNVEVYDHELSVGGNDLGINFSRILISKITTDNKGATSQEYYKVNYYGA